MAALAGLHTGAMGTGVLVGDFNASPDAPELEPLQRGASPTRGSSRRTEEDRAGWRFWTSGQGLTHPATGPRRRIDQVWVSPGVSVVSARVLDAEGASDHLPLVVDLLVPSGV